jgi:type I restriction enzyme S subunit
MRVDIPNRLKPVANDVTIDSDLPEGWVYPEIGEILTVNYGKGLKESVRVPKHVPVYGSNGIVGRHNVALTQGPTIIIGRKGTVGAVHFSNDPCWAIDTTYFIDEFNGLDSRYLVHVLRSLNLTELDTSTAIPGLNRDGLYDQHLPLAPLPEQRRIAAKVEELLARVNAAKERLAKVQAILKRFRQAVLAAACSGRLTADWRENNPDIESALDLLIKIQQERKKTKKSKQNRRSTEGDIYFDIPETWSFCCFEDICANKPSAIRAGPFGSSLTKSFYTPSGYKIYGQEQVIRGDASYGSYYIDEKKFWELRSCEVEAGDLLISLVGTIGKVLIIPDKFEKGIINPRLVKISLYSEVSPEYIAKYLTSLLARNSFKRDSHGGTMESLNLQMLKRLPIPLPPLIEQHEIVRRVESMFKLADAVEKRVAAATARAEKLTHAILAKAFRGELVPTEAELARREGRSYESASELLARIKSERESKGVIERRRRNKAHNHLL